MMEYPVLGMTSLHGHIKAAVSLFVKINPHINQLPYPCGGLTDNHPHNLLITISGTCNHGIPDMLLEIIGFIHHRCYTTLGIVGVAVIKHSLGNETYSAMSRSFNSKRQTGNTRANNQKII